MRRHCLLLMRLNSRSRAARVFTLGAMSFRNPINYFFNVYTSAVSFDASAFALMND